MNDFLLNAIQEIGDSHPSRVFIRQGEAQITYGEVQRLLAPESDSQSSFVNLTDQMVAYVNYLRSRQQWLARARELICEDFGLPFDRYENLICEIPGEFLRTSGTTGSAKAVYVAFSAQERTARSINDIILDGREDCELVLLPFSHSSGGGRMRAAAIRGGTVIFAGSPVQPKTVFRELVTKTPLMFALTPATWRYLRRFAGETIWDRCANVTAIEFGSAPLTDPEVRELSENLPHDATLKMHFGSTEASRSFVRDLRDSSPAAMLGRPLPHVQCSFEPVPGSNFQELKVRGPHVARFVLDERGEILYDSLRDAWLSTGDQFDLEDPERPRYVGRRDNTANVGGHIVSLEIVEESLRSRGLVEHFAVGKQPHAILGEELVLVLEREANQMPFSLSETMTEGLKPHEIPSRIIVLPQLPQLSSGKLDRQAILRIAQAE